MLNRIIFALAITTALSACGNSKTETPENKPPIVTVTSSHEQAFTGENVTISSNVTDEDSTSLLYTWQQLSGPSISLENSQLATLSFVAPEVESNSQITLQLTVKDNKPQVTTTTVSIEIIPHPLQAPDIITHTDGENFIAEQTVTLAITGYDVDGYITQYNWQQLSGPSLQFTNENEESISAFIPELTIHSEAEFEVTATDNDGLSTSKTFTINLFPQYEKSLISGRADGKGVDLVILAEGFTEQELAEFDLASEKFIKHFSEETTINSHISAWNFHKISAISAQSGSDFPNDDVYIDTVFDSYFQCNNIERLLCINSSKVLAVTAKLVPQFDQVIVIVNSRTYGGVGGQVATFSLADAAMDIAVHELGHSFAGLADEYSYGDSSTEIIEPTEPNVTTETNIDNVKWKHWIDDLTAVPTQPGELGVGLFEGARYREKGYYRPMDNSIMRVLAQPFGPVNAEAWVLSVYRTAGSVLGISPNEELVTHPYEQSLEFSVDTIFTQSKNTIKWFIDDVEQLNNTATLSVELPPGSTYVVRVEISDTTGLIRQDPYKYAQFVHSWTVTEE